MIKEKAGREVLGRGWKTVKAEFPLNIRASMESGQPLTFHSVYKIDDGIATLSYVTGRGVIELRYKEGRPITSFGLRYHGNYTSSSAGCEVATRLGLSDKMDEIYGSIGTDRHMKGAIAGLYGMRVTQNEPWETTLCFVISQFNNIRRIKGIVRAIINRYGEELESDGRTTRLFPGPEALASASIEDLRQCGAGFRARYIKAVAEACSGSLDLEALKGMEYAEAKKALIGVEGIGEKVADCILLMGYKKLSAFPVDVWIKRSVELLYFNGRKASTASIQDFAEKRWGCYAGYAQQYLFHGSRTGVLKLP